MNQNSTIDETAADYDNRGAMIYIVIVLLWYSVGIIFMLAMQMKARSEIIEEAARRRTKMLIQDLRKHRNTKEVLGKCTSNVECEGFILINILLIRGVS